MKTVHAALIANLMLAAAIFPAEAAPPLQVAQASPAPSYVPPLRGAPSRRVGGSSRGVDQTLPFISVVAPDHVGLTISEKPVLYWFISKPTRVMLEITLIDENGVKPMLELPVVQVEGPAIHSLDLARHGIVLKPGMEYQWTVTLVPDAKERSGDVISGGVIKLVTPPPTVREMLAKANLAELPPATLAAEGLWYDAIHVLSQKIASQPGNKELRAERAALAEQVGLREIADFDRKQ